MNQDSDSITLPQLRLSSNQLTKSQKSLTHSEFIGSKGNIKALSQSQRGKSLKLHLESLLTFLFPPELQHPMSTGRLFAFGFYGPLDENSKLRAPQVFSKPKKRQSMNDRKYQVAEHVIQNWELDTMCKRFEREIILQAYLGSESFELLSENEVEAVIAQADRRTKVAKGKAGMKQITQQEVRDLFSDLPVDEEERLSFHDMQKRIERYRQQLIEELKVIFPELMRGSKKKGNAEKITLDPSASSKSIANPSNFFHIANIEQRNLPELTQNIGLIREQRTPEDGRVWDYNCCLRGTHVGGFVKAAKSATTVKKKA